MQNILGLPSDSKRLRALNMLFEAGKNAKSAIVKSTFDTESSSLNLSLINQIKWSSSRAEGLKSLLKLVDIFRDFEAELPQSLLFDPKIEVGMMHAIVRASQVRQDDKPLRLTEIYQNATKFKYHYVDFSGELKKLTKGYIAGGS